MLLFLFFSSLLYLFSSLLLSFAFNTGTFVKIFALDFDFCFLRFMYYFVVVVVVSGILVVVVVTRAFFLLEAGDLFLFLLLYIYKCLYNIYI